MRVSRLVRAQGYGITAIYSQGSKIGANCVIGQNVMIGPEVVVGDNCKIQNNVSLYKGVLVEQGVFIGPSAVFTNVKTPALLSIERLSLRKPT